MMTLSRRSFFTKLAGAVVAVKAMPCVASFLPPGLGSTGGAHIGALSGAMIEMEASAGWQTLGPLEFVTVSDDLLRDSEVSFADLLPRDSDVVTFEGVWDDAMEDDGDAAVLQRQGL